MDEERDKRYEQRFLAERDARASALSAAQTAVDKAEANALRWQENANEWRQAMNDKDKGLPTRNEVDQQFKALNEKIESDHSKSIAMIFSVISAIGVIGVLILEIMRTSK
jgi:hypothetical protein